MKLHEKLKQVREGLGLTIQDVADKILQIFGKKKAISYRTLYRIEQGHISKFSSVEQICYGMGVQIPVVLKDTELEDRQIIRKKDRIDEFAGEGYLARVVSSPMRSFLGLHIILDPKRKMPEERSPQGNYEKWIFVIKGELICKLGEEKHILKYMDSISFKSHITHQLENNGKIPCEFIQVLNPKHF